MALTKVGKEGITGISNASDATAITITSAEKVGIGESAPQSELHIKTADASATAQSGSALVIEGTDATRADLQFLGDAGAFQAIYFGDNSDADIGRIAYDHTGNSMRFTVNAAERLRIGTAGQVSIGTTSTSGSDRVTIKGSTADSTTTFLIKNSSDTTLFDVRNDGRCKIQNAYSETTGNSANLFVDTDGRLIRATSSERYKNTITDATHGLAEVLKLRSVTYKGNNDGDTVFGGLIAEEVHDAGLTEFVQYNTDNQPDALAYGNMVSLCIKAIQELKAENTALANRITALEGA